MWTTYSAGQYVPSENSMVCHSIGPKVGHGVLFLHGYEPNGASNWQTVDGDIAIIKALTDAGLTVVSADAGGQSTWGNITAMTAIDALYAYITGIAGGTKISIVGQSMGGQNALVWASRNKSKVSAVVGIIPVINLAAMSAVDQPYAYQIAAAYGGSYTPQTPSTDPAILASSMDDVRVQLWAGDTDTVCIPEYALTFQDLSGCELNMVSGGHAEATIMNVDPQQVVDFLLE